MVSNQSSNVFGRGEMNETTIQSGAVFDLSGGHISLDFANTLENRLEQTKRDRLRNYGDLVAWALQEKIITDEEAQRRLKKAETHPVDAIVIYERAIALREAIFRIMEKVTERATPDKADLAILNEMLSQAMAHSCIIDEGDGCVWGWTENGEVLEVMLWVVARATAELLSSELRSAVRACAAEDCAFLFLDTSKNHSRRWCDMKTCGNRAKVRRYTERQK